MNLARARIVVRPRHRTESMDLAFRFVLGDRLSIYLALAVAALLPAFALAASVRIFYGFSWLAVWAVALPLGSVTYGVFTVAAGRMMFEENVTAEAIARSYLRRLIPYLTAMFVTRALITLGYSLVAPGIVASARYAHVPEAVLLEQLPVVKSLARSARLSTAGGDAFGTVLAGAIISLSIVLGVETVFLAVVRDLLSIPFPGDRLLVDGGSFAALVGYFASIPWAATHRFLAYIDGRTRQDGWDVQVRLMALAQGTAT